MTKRNHTAFALFAALLFSAPALQAQDAATNDENLVYYTAQEFPAAAAGRPFSDIRYVEALGSAYFDLQWTNGTIITKTGQAYRNVPVRIDLMAHKVHYKADNGQEMVVGAPIKEVRYEAGDKTIQFINGDALPGKHSGWFQVLADGEVKLLKSFRKTFEERMSFGKTELSIKTMETLVVTYNNKEMRVKKPADIVNLVPAHKATLEQELKSLKSKSKEDQLIALATSLNALLKS